MQDQEAGKFIIDSAESLVEPSAPLPEIYGENRLVILPRDPLWFFAYWEITPQRIDEFRQEFGPDLWDRGECVLRVCDVTGLEGDQVTPHRYFDVPVQLNARRWYIQVDRPGRTYFADLGVRLPGGRFASLLRSNRITLPGGRVSEQTDSQWMAVSASEWNQLLDISGSEQVRGGSAEVARAMAQRWEFLRSVFSASFSRPPSSSNFPARPSEKPHG